MEYIEKEKEVGGTPSGAEDALTKALGKRDHRGYVKGFGRFGVGVGQEKAFGKSARLPRRSTPGYAEVESLKASLTEEFEEKHARMTREFEERMNRELAQQQAKMNAEFQKTLQEQLQQQVAAQLQAALASFSPWGMPSANIGMPVPQPQPPTLQVSFEVLLISFAVIEFLKFVNC